MALAWSMVFVFLPLLLINRADSTCTKFFECGRLGTLEYPLTNRRGCGLFLVNNCSTYTSVQFGAGDVQPYYILQKMSTNGLWIYDHTREHRGSSVCLALRNLSLPLNPSVSFTVTPNLTMFLCPNQYSDQLPDIFEHYYNSSDCPLFQVYYRYPVTNDPVPYDIPSYCSAIQVPINTSGNPNNLTDFLTPEFLLEWSVSEACNECHNRGGSCLADHRNEFQCDRETTNPGSETTNRRKVTIASLASGGGALLITTFVVAVYILWRRKKRMKEDYLLSRGISFDPSLKSDVEGGSFHYGVPIFSYTELEEATNNFDPSKELGDGGFGTVYHGKLRDGREVAIKHLYEHNCRRVQQFINEIKILTTLRHQNLVSLYGCTSRRSRELLLVYEYIPNGTLADHLHGPRASEARLPWPARMRIAIETASALAYLHKSDIIHRDVKTNNILLDDSFRVKVADFGLSRLFPDDVTHVSTAPQGTPGYVDPDYHQCYQLTSKSDVYSFGVVLIELVSSLPAVDITRHRHEINLANLAVNKIQRCAFEELVDPVLGYTRDAEVARMTTLVAELAFRCLQLDKDLRPSMDEVVDSLRDVEGKEGHDGNFGKVELKEKDLQSSPNGVMDVWVSGSSTTSSSVS